MLKRCARKGSAVIPKGSAVIPKRRHPDPANRHNNIQTCTNNQTCRTMSTYPLDRRQAKEGGLPPEHPPARPRECDNHLSTAAPAATSHRLKSTVPTPQARLTSSLTIPTYTRVAMSVVVRGYASMQRQHHRVAHAVCCFMAFRTSVVEVCPY